MCSLSWREPNDVAGPFTVTTAVAGPFAVECPSYALATLAKVMPGGEDRDTWMTRIEDHVGDPRAWAAFVIVCAVTATLAWLARTRWPYAAVLLYTCWLLAAFAPLSFSLAVMWGRPDGDLTDAADVLSWLYLEGWPFWIVCGILLVSQILLLALPIRLVKERPIPRRSIWVTAIAAATLFSLIIVGVTLSVAAALWGDEGAESGWFSLLFVLFSWALWAWVFRTFAHTTDARGYVRRVTRWLLQGSILELLVAVPSHIIVRQKDTCCAHGVTAAGISTGLVVMLISFGPGIYFLYMDRIRRKSPHIEDAKRAIPEGEPA